MVACPQNGTSHSGEKYRTRHAPPSGAAKAVSENPTSAAIACIFDAGGKSSPIQIPAGLPPLLPSENAAMRRTVMLVILFPVHFLPPSPFLAPLYGPAVRCKPNVMIWR